jgi:hypothetical protein
MSTQTEADFHLLQAAAKAAGIAVRKSGGMLFVDVSRPNGVVTGREWNAWKDSADALELAVRLRMPIEPIFTMGGAYAGVNVWPHGRGDCAAIEKYDDHMAAWRHAIVRAAAAISEGEQK